MNTGNHLGPPDGQDPIDKLLSDVCGLADETVHRITDAAVNARLNAILGKAGYTPEPELEPEPAGILDAARHQAEEILAAARRSAAETHAEAACTERAAEATCQEAARVIAEAAQYSDAALDRASSIIADARAQADLIIAGAETEASKIIADARLRAALERQAGRRESDLGEPDAGSSQTLLTGRSRRQADAKRCESMTERIAAHGHATIAAAILASLGESSAPPPLSLLGWAAHDLGIPVRAHAATALAALCFKCEGSPVAENRLRILARPASTDENPAKSGKPRPTWKARIARHLFGTWLPGNGWVEIRHACSTTEDINEIATKETWFLCEVRGEVCSRPTEAPPARAERLSGQAGEPADPPARTSETARR